MSLRDDVAAGLAMDPSFPSFDTAWEHDSDCCYGNYDDAHWHGVWMGRRDALAALPPGAEEAYELGRAWQRVWAALPEGCALVGVRRSQLGMKDQWVASYEDAGGWFNFYGPIPAAALLALADKLEQSKTGREP